MAEYTAPLRDMRFVINDLIGFERLQALAGFDEVTADLSDAVLEEAAKLASEVLSPLNRVGDTVGCKWEDGVVTTPPGWREAYRAFCEGGWNGLAMNPEFGGQGLPKVLATAVGEMWDAANMAFGLCPMLTGGAIEAIEQHGSDALRATFLAQLISGTWTGTMNLTEPQAGSDLSAVRTRAVPNGDHYLVTGQKIFITYGEHDLTDNIIHLVLARLPDAPEGTRGISLFAVPKFLVNADGSLGPRNDLRCVSIEHKLGIHGSPTAVMSYGDNGGAVGYLVGELNRGLMHMFTMMNAARHAVGREGMAIAERAYQKALEHARERVQGQAPGAGPRATIVEHPDVKRMLMSMKCQIEAMRALAYVCAVEYDTAALHPDADVRARAERRGDVLTPIVKAWSTETGVQIASLGVQVHGGMGYVEETGAAQHLRDARIAPIYEGTTGIQAGDLVGRKTLRDGGHAMRELIADMRATVADLQSQGGTVALARDALAAAVDDLETVVAWICGAASDPRLPAAAAVSYLELAGLTCGGWLMAQAAARAAAAGEGDDFHRAKLASAGFYAAQILPRTAALARVITEGSALVADLDTALL
ncbi:MAG: acyl-CoA dehydrogenase C-terminal domain-containing protein [Gammaproteobacteria bacterium]|nr:acyl-CoA dehydrogenase C-terminal domain-containing protein [Gammaproteobacteria bacterium]